MLTNGLNIKKVKEQHAQIMSKALESFFDGEDEKILFNMPSGAAASSASAKSSLKKNDLQEDDAIYDYDGVYDSMKSGDREAQKVKELDKKERKPKYLQNLFQMAEVRKQDRLRAEDVKLQREREAEGDEFADKEKFVTGAYRAQQEEVRRLKEEEAEKEAELRSQAAGLSAFKQNLLEKDLRKHEEVVQASLQGRRSHQSNEISEEIERSRQEQEKIKEAEAKLGHKVALNDDNQIVDHRQLLGAGLNRTGKSAKHLQTAELAKKARPVLSQKDREDRQAQISRQQVVLQAQLQESRKRQAEEVARQEAALRTQAKRTKTEADVSSAKERYLARKRAAAEAEAMTEA